MTLRFEAEVRSEINGPFERCLVTAEAWGGDFAAFFRVTACEKLLSPEQEAFLKSMAAIEPPEIR